jgi:hypothetical protein
MCANESSLAPTFANRPVVFLSRHLTLALGLPTMRFYIRILWEMLVTFDALMWE